MKKSFRPIVTVALGAALMTGVAGCGVIDNIDPSRLPEISIPALPSRSAEPVPPETTDPEPVPTQTVTDAPKPRPTVTAESKPAATVTAEPEPTSTAAPVEEADDSSFVWWPWALATVVLLVIIILVARRKSVRDAWAKRLHEAKSELSWLEDSLIPQVLSKPTAAEAAALWQAARPRILDLDRELHELADGGVTEAGSATAAHGLQALQALTTSVDAETSTHDVTDADALRARRAAVEEARAYARAWISPPQH